MKKLMFVVSMAAILGGCAVSQPPEVLTKRNPADAHDNIRNSHYRPVVNNYNHREPVGPRSWRRLNDEQAPKKGANS